MELFFPKSALADIRTFVGLSDNQLEKVSASFDAPTAESAYGQFIDEIRTTLGLSSEDARSVSRVGSFLLAAIDQGVQADTIVDDLHASVVDLEGADDPLAATINAKRAALLRFLGPKPRRARATKIRYLKSGPHPSATSFRTVCDLRPLFDEAGAEIEGLVPTLFLEVKTEDPDGEEDTHVIHLSRSKLKELLEVLERTQKKFAAMDRRYGKELLTE